MSKAFKYQQTRQFKFWFDQTLLEGMQYEAELFQCICSLNYNQRQAMYHQAAQLAQLGADTIITYKNGHCHLWLNLRNKSLLQTSTVFLQSSPVETFPELSISDTTSPMSNTTAE